MRLCVYYQPKPFFGGVEYEVASRVLIDEDWPLLTYKHRGGVEHLPLNWLFV